LYTMSNHAVDPGHGQLNDRVAAGVAAVERLLHDETKRAASIVSDKAQHPAEAGRKRLRPTTSLPSSEFGSKPGTEKVIKTARVVEMVHVAALYHDDVMDGADRRRGVESANSRWNNSVAILSGDALLAHASRLMSQLDTHTVEQFAAKFEELVTGQMR